MQKLIIILFIAIAAGLLGSCKKHDGNDYVSGNGVSLALLKVDYQTHKFEGGKVFHFNDNGLHTDIPVQMTYIPPGDFGNMTLLYAPTGDSIFDGSIVWSGKGKMTYPTLTGNFPAATGTVATPDSNAVQIISPYTYIKKAEYNIPAVWAGISNLLITKEFSRAHARTGLFLYTPSVGMGDPADWDYFWILYADEKQEL